MNKNIQLLYDLFPAMDSPNWLQLRQTVLGGTDTSVILGKNKWSDLSDLYLSKTTEVVNTTTNIPMLRGQTLEPLVAKVYQERTNYKVYEMENRLFRHPLHEFIGGTPDRIVESPDGHIGILEIKTAAGRGVEKFYNGIPDMYSIQAQKYWLILDEIFKTNNINVITFCDMAIMLNDEIEIISIKRDNELRRNIIKADFTFWTNHIKPKIPPTPYTYESLKEKYKDVVVGSKLEIVDNNEVAHRLLELLKIRRELEIQIKVINDELEAPKAAKEGVEKEIREMIADFETVVYNNDVILTCKKTSDSFKFNEDMFKKTNPDLYQQYLEPKFGFRKLSFKNKFIDAIASSSNIGDKNDIPDF